MQTMFKQSLLLILTPLVLSLSTGISQADELEVKAGNVEVSVDNGQVEVTPGATSIKNPSLMDRINNLRIFGNRNPSSTRGHTSSTSSRDCKGSSSGYSTTRSNSSGTAVSRSSSSSTTISCN